MSINSNIIAKFGQPSAQYFAGEDVEYIPALDSGNPRTIRAVAATAYDTIEQQSANSFAERSVIAFQVRNDPTLGITDPQYKDKIRTTGKRVVEFQFKEILEEDDHLFILRFIRHAVVVGGVRNTEL